MSRAARPRRKAARSLSNKRESAAAPELYGSGEEDSRAAVLGSLGVLDTPTEERFDRICRLAQDVMQAPATYISLLDRERQWFKSSVGMGDMKETPREGTFCDYAIRRSAPTVVLDAVSDPMFKLSPYVQDGPKVRFYAGMPLIVSGQRVGTLCALDFEPRSEVSKHQLDQLYDLARIAEAELAGAAPPETPSPPPCQRREVTLLCASLPGSAQLFDQMEPEAVMAILNLCLEPMIAVARRWQGTLDDISASGLRVVFAETDDHPARAAACALEMMSLLLPIAQALEERDAPALSCGIGLHSGEVVLGPLGAEGTWKPSLVGGAVGLAESLKALAGPGQILASDPTIEGLGGLGVVEGQLRVTLPGTASPPLLVHDLVGLKLNEEQGS